MSAWSTTSTLGSLLLSVALGACGSEQSGNADTGADAGDATGGAPSSGAVPGAGGGGTGGRDDGVSSGGGDATSASGAGGSGGTATGGGEPAGTEGGMEPASGGGDVASVGGSGVGGSAQTGEGGLADDSGGSSSVGGNETGGAGGGSDTAGTGGGGNETGGAGGSGDTPGTGGGGDEMGGAGGSDTPGIGGGGGETGGTAGGGAGTGGAGTGGTFEGCTPGRLDDTAICNTPDFLSGEPGDEVDCIGELEGRWGSVYATVGGQQYFLQVNEWGSSEAQTMAHGGDYFFRMTVQEADTGSQGAGAPNGFPSIFIGSNGGHTTGGSNLPIAIGATTSAPTTWIWNDNGSLADTEGNIFNAAYDVWFNEDTSQSTQSGPTGGYLMVWLYDPPYAEPIGETPAFTDVTLAGVDGTWDIWIGLNGSRPCISYVRTEMTYEMSFDLKYFIDDAITRPDAIDAGWALTNVFAGFEIWAGSQGVETTAFCAFVE